MSDAGRPEVAAALAAVREGLDLARAGQADRAVSVKDGRDIVTTSDVAVERLLRGRLGDAFGHPVVGEEDGGEVPADGAAHWLVDPICGTRNYASGTPLWCVNLALVDGDEVVLGVVGDPTADEVLVAERGRGARAIASDGSSRPLAVSDASATAIVEDGRATGAERDWAAAFTAEVIRADRWDFRCLSSTLSSAYLASDRVLAYVCFYLTPLHGAAGVLLAEEAGAVTSDVTGAPWSLASRSLVAAATPALHDDLLAIAAATRPAR